ncbi:MAG: PLDc N-terminal domain-containing protein [Actinobacteria bacterium]|nr:PLDc N-terminal domain-containing protein [Actinomycetota bacterium]
MDDGNFLWTMLIIFFMVFYFMLLFLVLLDIFRDHKMSGWIKLLWIIALLFFHFITLFIYIIFRGRGMSERQQASAVENQEARQAYIQSMAGTNPTEQIASAKVLLDAGTITQAEFDSLKTKALA